MQRGGMYYWRCPFNVSCEEIEQWEKWILFICQDSKEYVSYNSISVPLLISY